MGAIRKLAYSPPMKSLVEEHGHIKKEDEILYPWMDRNLSMRQVGELFARFRAVDERFAEDRKKYESFVERLEDAYAEILSEVVR